MQLTNDTQQMLAKLRTRFIRVQQNESDESFAKCMELYFEEHGLMHGSIFAEVVEWAKQ